MTATVLHLPMARSLGAIDVARLTDAGTYARGVEYTRAGRVVVTDRGRDAVTAVVTGTFPYLVHIGYGRSGLEYRCTCPVDTDGMFCKHVVAVALTVRGDEGPVDLAAHRRAIAANLETAEHDAADGRGWWVRAHGVLDAVDDLLAAGQAAEVVGLCEDFVGCLERNGPDIEDTCALVDLAARLGDLHQRACENARPEPVALARRLFDAQMHDDLGAFADGPERYAGVLGPTGLAEYQRLAAVAWKGPQGRYSELALSLDRFRVKAIVESLARATGPASSA